MKKGLIAEICVALIVLLFTYTSLTKFLGMEAFIEQLRVSPVTIIKSHANIFAWLIPISEATLVLFLTLNVTKKAALFCSLALLCVFEIYIGALLMSGLKLPCSCGGVINKLSWKEHLVFNGVFIILNVTAMLIYRWQRPSNGNNYKHKELSRA